MRMLVPRELYRAQGVPDSYVLLFLPLAYSDQGVVSR